MRDYAERALSGGGIRLSFLIPAIFVALYFGAIQLTVGIAWPLELWTGSIDLAGGSGSRLPCSCSASVGEQWISREPASMLARPADVVRSPVVLLLALVTIACGGGQSPTSDREPSPVPSTAPVGSAWGEATDDVAAFATELQAAGAGVAELGILNPHPLGGRGVRLCVAGQEVRVYLYATEQEREAVSSRIDPNDPSNLGTAMVAWAGNPRFWQRGRIIVLYLGDKPAVEAGITSVLGQPFARGQGRAGGPGANDC